MNIESLGFESINPNQEFSKQSKYLVREKTTTLQRREKKRASIGASNEICEVKTATLQRRELKIGTSTSFNCHFRASDRKSGKIAMELCCVWKIAMEKESERRLKRIALLTPFFAHSQHKILRCELRIHVRGLTHARLFCWERAKKC